ncbi:MAG: VWA domain-containing protein [Lentisphaerae bacterium]|nr:VWA domain-containing protein [Lentisphaerota bacterium]MCP4102233.1 VWA domain-containing protein [Lentisphaerota bacterium]
MGLNNLTPLIWLLIIIPLLFAYRKTLVNRSKWLRCGAFTLRCLGILLILLAICRPYWKSTTHKRHFAFLVDVSDSVSMKSAEASLKRIDKAVKDMRRGDSWEMFYFASTLRKTTPQKLKIELEKMKAGQSSSFFRRDTDLPNAIRGAAMTFPGNKVKAMVLFSDGVSTEPGLANAIKAFRYQGGKIYFEQEGGIDAQEVAIVDFKSSGNSTYPGETVSFEVTAMANCDLKAKVRLLNRSVLIKSRNISLKANQPEKVVFELPVIEENGAVWNAEIVADDHFPENNVSSCVVRVLGQPKVLALHIKPAKLALFKRALQKQGIEIEARGQFGFPGSMQELLEFDAVILADFPADAMTTKQMRMLRDYVQHFGCGLIMTGSDNSFGLGGYYKTPVEDVLPSVSRYEKEKEQPSLAMVLIIDKSGSMSGMPISLARQAAKAAVDLLGGRDKIGIVTFDGQANTITDLTRASNKMTIKSQIDQIAAGGGTNLYPAMVEAGSMLRRSNTKLRHMIILSDGQSRAADFESEGERLNQSGITISTVALGTGAHRALMRRLAEIGRGRCYKAMSPEAMPRIFARETVKASRSAIKEEPFCAVKVNGASFLNGIDFDKAPYLLGFVLTRTKPSARTLLLCEDGSPLLTFGQFGLGKSCCFTSGITSEWASEWLEWNGFPKLWAQALRAVMPSPGNSNIKARVLTQGNSTKITLEYADEKGLPIPAVKWDTRIASRQNSSPPLLEVTETGYGKYSLTTKLPPGFSGSLMLRDPTSGQSKTINFALNYPSEYRLTAKMSPILSSLDNLDTAMRSNDIADTKHSLASIMSIVGMLMLITGILLRRV